MGRLIGPRAVLAGIALGLMVIVMAWRQGQMQGDAESPQPRDRMLPSGRQAALRYVALGDSTVEGIGSTGPGRHYVGRLYERLRSVYPNAELANLGVGGATAADVLAFQLPNALERQPDLVTLSVGPNDITQGRDADQYEQDLAAIFERLRADTRAVVVVNLMPDLGLSPAFGSDEQAFLSELTPRFNQVLERQARRFDVRVVDLYAQSRLEVPYHPELFSSDLYHPSDAGYARWAEYMWAGIATAIGRQ